MKINNYIFFLIFIWSTFVILLPTSNSNYWSLFILINYYLFYAIAVFTLLFKPSILNNKAVLLVLLWSIYVSIINIFNINNTPIKLWEVLIDVNWWPIIFIIFYNIFRLDFNSNYFRIIKIYFPVYFLIVCAFVVYNMIFLAKSYSENIDLVDQEQINSIFWVLLLTPYLFFVDNKYVKYLLLFTGLIIIIISTKRSALIAIGFTLIVSIYYDIKNSKKVFKNFIFTIILLLLTSTIVLNYIDLNNVSALARLSGTNIEEEARFEFIIDSWNKYKSKDLHKIFFGSGHRSSAIDRGHDMLSKTVHNDLFEVLYDYGIFGLILYLYIIFYFIKKILKLRKYDMKLFVSYLSSIIIFIVLSSVSHLILYPTYFAFIIILWSLIESKTSITYQPILQ